MLNVRAVARRIKNQSAETVRRALLRRSLKDLERTLRAKIAPDKSLVRRLVKNWGNESYSANNDVLFALLKWGSTSKGEMLECGSGLSTLVLGTIAWLSERRLIALEHHVDWADRVRTAMPPSIQQHASVRIAPVKRYGAFDWYSIDLAAMPQRFGFIFCDGPPGSTFGGRYGLGPVLREHLAPDCIIVLDDTEREDERSIVRRWCAELGATIVEEGATFSVLKVAGADLNRSTASAPAN